MEGSTPSLAFAGKPYLHKNKMKGDKEKMAKEKMVTRTMKTTTICAMCVDTDTGEVFNGKVTVAGEIKTEKMQEKLFNEKYIAPDYVENWKCVKIVETTVVSKLLGITESEFLAHAVEITK